MLGILTEKPSAARNFAKALGGMRGTFNGEDYVIVNAVGHLYEFVDPEKQVKPALQERYHKWNLQYLPWNEKDMSWKRQKKKGVNDVINNIKNTLSKCDEIVLACDVDPSGEGGLLAWEPIYENHIRAKKFSRMYFIDESVKEIQKAFKTRKVLSGMTSHDEFQMAYYRARWDFLSMQFTRIATACGDGRSVLRQGRLKSAMVVIVGDQLKLLKAYKKVPFYTNKFKDENGIIYSSEDEPSFPKKEQVPNIYSASPVVCDSKQMKRTSPPKLPDLAALSSQLVARGARAKEVTEIYQKMYEAQIVSYPRTEDKTISPEQFNDMLPLVNKIATVVGVNPSILTHRTPRSTHVKTGGAHGANRPGSNVPASLDALTQYGRWAPDIYKILAISYLSMLCEDYEYEQQKGHLAKYPKFVGTANVPKKLGFKAILKDDDDIDADESAKGLGTKAQPFVHEGFPPKPAQPTMKWLMKQLEQRDVGTGATRTNIYAEVTNDKAKYPLLVDKKGKISMSQYGDMSYLLLKDTHIGSLDITEQLMHDMREIAKGNFNPDVGLHNMQKLVLDDIETMRKNSVLLRKEMGIMSKDFEQKEKYTGIWVKTNTEVAFNRKWSTHRFTDEECERLLNGEKISIFGLQGKNGEYGVEGMLTEQEYNGHKYVGFERLGFANKDGSRVPRSWAQHTFTEDERLMLEQGLSVSRDDWVSKKSGKKFSAKVRFGVDDNGVEKIIPDFG